MISSPLSLRSYLDGADQVVDARLEAELVVERRVERDRDAAVGRDRPALAADALDEDLVRLEHVAVDLEAAAVELRETRPRRARPPTSRSAAPSFGPSTGRFGFTRSSEASTSPNSTSFTRSSSAISSACAAASGAPATTSRRSGWRSFSPERRARLPAELDHPAHARRSRRAAPRPARAPRASRRGAPTPAPPAHEVPPEVVGEERHHRRDHAQRLDERVPERPERGRRPPARSAGASGGCTSSRGRRRTPRTRGSRSRSASPRTPPVASRTSSCVRSTSQRSSGRSDRRARLEVGEHRLEAVDVPVADEERRPSSRASAACA